jgi:hypothetical protein
MKIVILGNFGTSWDGSICDEQNIANSLLDMEHDVYPVQREATQSEGFEASIAAPDTELVLISQWANYPAELVEIIKRACPNATVVYWAFDYQWHSNEAWHFNLATKADIFLSKELAHREHYLGLGANFHWLPQDFAPDFLADQEVPDLEQDIDVLFTGSHLTHARERLQLLEAVDNRFNLLIHSVTPDQFRSDGRKHVEGPVMDKELVNLIPRAKIHLSVDIYQSEGYWSDRNAQIMALGGFVLFKYVPMAEHTFKNYVAYFHTIDEALEQIQWYLSQDSERKFMAERGKRFARWNLLTRNRVKDMLEVVREHRA